jgi:nucleotide-binding universal stress UspA family protein
VPAYTFGGAGYTAPLDPAEFERVARDSLERAVAEVMATNPAEVEIEPRAVEGAAASVLLDEVRNLDAAMLVVGSRGHGGFAGLLLGSVSASLTHHTRCPLLIIPAAPVDAPVEPRP